MTDLTKQLEQALIPMHPNDRIRFADMSHGIQCHADRLAPLHAALLKCVEVLECSVKRYEEAFEKNQNSTYLARGMTHGTYVSLGYALADLRKALEEGK